MKTVRTERRLPVDFNSLEWRTTGPVSAGRPTIGSRSVDPADASVRAIHPQYCWKSPQENLEVFPDAPVPHVAHFEINHALEVSDVVPPTHLPRTRNTWPHLETRIVVFVVQRDLLRHG